jgi:DNA-binding CsgD family transcriptional regulator
MVKAQAELFSEGEWSVLSDAMGLTARQMEILRHLVAGLNDRDIARCADVGIPTVRTHLTRLFARLGVQDRNELVVCVFRQFLAQCQARGHGRQAATIIQAAAV